jgi:hypothetical protein
MLSSSVHGPNLGQSAHGSVMGNNSVEMQGQQIDPDEISIRTLRDDLDLKDLQLEGNGEITPWKVC